MHKKVKLKIPSSKDDRPLLWCLSKEADSKQFTQIIISQALKTGVERDHKQDAQASTCQKSGPNKVSGAIRQVCPDKLSSSHVCNLSRAPKLHKQPKCQACPCLLLDSYQTQLFPELFKTFSLSFETMSCLIPTLCILLECRSSGIIPAAL